MKARSRQTAQHHNTVDTVIREHGKTATCPNFNSNHQLPSSDDAVVSIQSPKNLIEHTHIPMSVSTTITGWRSWGDAATLQKQSWRAHCRRRQELGLSSLSSDWKSQSVHINSICSPTDRAVAAPAAMLLTARRSQVLCRDSRP